MTEDDSNDEKSGTEVGNCVKRFADQESCATTRGRVLVGAITRSAEQRVVWRSAVQKLSSGGSGFDPSFSETEKVRVVCIDQIG